MLLFVFPEVHRVAVGLHVLILGGSKRWEGRREEEDVPTLTE